MTARSPRSLDGHLPGARPEAGVPSPCTPASTSSAGATKQAWQAGGRGGGHVRPAPGIRQKHATAPACAAAHANANAIAAAVAIAIALAAAIAIACADAIAIPNVNRGGVYAAA
jgi:hypothetical protein